MAVRPTFGEIVGELRQIMTETTPGFFSDAPAGIAGWLNEGIRLEYQYALQALNRDKNIGLRAGHPFLSQFVGHVLGKVLKGTSRLLDATGAAPGPDLRGRTIFSITAEGFMHGLLFNFRPPSEVELAKGGVRFYRPIPGRAYWTWRDNEAEPDFLFPTGDGKAHEDIPVRVILLRLPDDLELFNGDPSQESPITSQYLAAPKDYALARMLEEQGEDPQVYEERMRQELQLVPSS